MFRSRPRSDPHSGRWSEPQDALALARRTVDDAARRRMSNRWFRRILVLCPTGIGLLWIAGMAHFRDVSLVAQEWLVLVAAGIAVNAILHGLQRARPLPPLPERTNPVTLAALAAAVIGVLALLFGGAFELIVGPMYPTETSVALRATWHAACAFGAAYCTFLLRLTQPRRGAPTGPPRAPEG